jgi:hypothetical protein
VGLTENTPDEIVYVYKPTQESPKQLVICPSAVTLTVGNIVGGFNKVPPILLKP